MDYEKIIKWNNKRIDYKKNTRILQDYSIVLAHIMGWAIVLAFIFLSTLKLKIHRIIIGIAFGILIMSLYYFLRISIQYIRAGICGKKESQYFKYFHSFIRQEPRFTSEIIFIINDEKLISPSFPKINISFSMNNHFMKNYKVIEKGKEEKFNEHVSFYYNKRKIRLMRMEGRWYKIVHNKIEGWVFIF